jgi:hypothetical protein
MIADVSAAIEISRQQWQDGYQRFLALAAGAAARDRLYVVLETISDELRRRIGQTFTLAEAVELYDDAERWATDAVAEHAAVRGWARDLAIVLDAAFHLYSRAAVDYVP